MTHLHYVWPKRTDVAAAAAVPAIVNFYVSIIWSARRGAEILKPLVGTRLSRARARCISQDTTERKQRTRSRARAKSFFPLCSFLPPGLRPGLLPSFLRLPRYCHFLRTSARSGSGRSLAGDVNFYVLIIQHVRLWNL